MTIDNAPAVVEFRRRKTAFDEFGYKETIAALVKEIQMLYVSDSIPWVVGYSGGKDSTAVLQLVWLAIEDLDPAQRHKQVNVVSTDTLVENPVVASATKSRLMFESRNLFFE